MGLLHDRHSQLLINGKLVAGSGGTFPTINPATEEVLVSRPTRPPTT